MYNDWITLHCAKQFATKTKFLSKVDCKCIWFPYKCISSTIPNMKGHHIIVLVFVDKDILSSCFVQKRYVE